LLATDAAVDAELQYSRNYLSRHRRKLHGAVTFTWPFTWLVTPSMLMIVDDYAAH